MTLLSVENLHVHFRTRTGVLPAVDGVSFHVDRGESLGVVGESGCGKTTLAKAILRILAKNGMIQEGRILYEGRDLLQMPLERFRQIRWQEISLVTQSAMNALDPVYRVGAQIVEAVRAHVNCSRREAWRRAEDLFVTVGLEPSRLRHYPHQFSGGMRQRAIVALALALDPSLVIADEPTTALDVIMQDQIFDEIKRLQKRGRKALVLITHDISLVSENCDRVAVMYSGRIVEMAPVQTIFSHPSHPYTIGLQNAFPDLRRAKQDLVSIPGAPPNLLKPLHGCRFASRCPFTQPICEQEEPSLVPTAEEHLLACHFPQMAPQFRELGRREKTWVRGDSVQVTWV